MHPYGIPLLNCFKLVINQKNPNDVTTWNDIIINSFWHCFVSLVKFSHWPKFHINIITGSGVMTIYFYKGLTRNPEIGNTPIWVLPNIWKLGQVRDTKFCMDVSNEMLLNAVKCQGYGFYSTPSQKSCSLQNLSARSLILIVKILKTL